MMTVKDWHKLASSTNEAAHTAHEYAKSLFALARAYRRQAAKLKDETSQQTPQENERSDRQLLTKILIDLTGFVDDSSSSA
ncbi:unnamed protein product, partial [marine sediment metagenome]